MTTAFQSDAFQNDAFQIDAAVAAALQQPRGILDLGRRRKTKRERDEEREKFGIPNLARLAIEAVAARQAARLELDKQKQFDELYREIQLRHLGWKAQYLEILNAEREYLVRTEIAEHLQKVLAKTREEEDILVLMAIAAVI